jgi:chemotaxis protein MotB
MGLPPIPQCPQNDHGGGGGERWLISYADMITLLLVLFIILYSTANQDLEKFKAISQSLSDGFGATKPNLSVIKNEQKGGAGDNAVLDKSSGGDSPLEMYEQNQSPIQIFQFQDMLKDGSALKLELDQLVEEALEEARRELGPGEMQGGIEITNTERGVVIQIHPDQILFDAGSARMKPQFKEILKLLTIQLRRLPNQIEVQGHTDSSPISTAAYPSNWELSAARAGAVVRQLQNLGLPPGQLSAAGYADTRPAADNETAEGRARNRRVEIVILHAGGAAVDHPQQPAAANRGTDVHEEADHVGH